MLLSVIAASSLIAVGCGIAPTANGTPQGASSVAVSIAPTRAVVQAGTSLQFTAPVTGTANTNVEWLAGGAVGGNSTSGTISPAGLYTAPQVVNSSVSIVVTAISTADASRSASATVTALPAPAPISVSISPTTATLQPGQAQQFSATVAGTTNTGVTWFVSGVQGGNSSVGTISSTGLYNAPQPVPTALSVTITATSTYSSTSSANATVSVLGSPAPPPSAYYVDASGGNDTNDGKSSATAWRTIAKVNASRFSPGDQILFNRGGVWREQLTVPSSGSAGNPITFAVYGTGANPLIDGGNAVTSWSNYSGNVWQGSLTNPLTWWTTPTVVLFNGVMGTPVANPSSITSPGQWYATSTTLYVYSVGSPTNVQASFQSDAIDSNGKQYFNVTGLTLQNTIYEPLLIRGGSGINIYGNTIFAGGVDCLQITNPSSGVSIYSNTISYCNANGIGLAYGGHVGDSIYNNDVSYSCWITDDRSAITIVDATSYNNSIYSNSIHDNNSGQSVGCRGVDLDTLGTSGVNFVYYNKVRNNDGGGIEVTESQGQQIYYNVVWGTNGTATSEWELQASSFNTRLGSNLFYGNTVYSYTIASYGCFQNWYSTANVWENNICILTTSTGTGFNTQGTGAATHIADYNLIYDTGNSHPYNWNGTNYASAAAFYAATNQGQHDINTNPQVANLSGFNFALQSTSPAINAGTNLGSTYQLGLDPRTSFPWGTVNQNSYGTGWEIGAFVFIP